MNNHISGFFNSVYRKQTFKWTDFGFPFPHPTWFPVSPSNFPHLAAVSFQRDWSVKGLGERTGNPAASVSPGNRAGGRGERLQRRVLSSRASVSSASLHIPATGCNNPTTHRGTQRFRWETSFLLGSSLICLKRMQDLWYLEIDKLNRQLRKWQIKDHMQPATF